MEAIRGINRLSLSVFLLFNGLAFWVSFDAITNDPTFIFKNIFLILPLIIVIAEIGYAIYRQRNPKVLESIRITDVKPNLAAGIIDDYLSGFEETEFGFPTGFFVPVESKEQNVYVYREQTLATGGIRLAVLVCVDSVRFVIERAMSIFRSEGAGWFFLIVAFVMSMLITVFLFFTIWIAVIGEAILKKFLASSMTVRVQEAPDQKNDSLVTIELRGMSAIKAEKSILLAFETPKRPALADA